MKTLSQRRAAKNRRVLDKGHGALDVTQGQINRVYENLRHVLAFCDANFRTKVDAHPGAGFTNAREALHGGDRNDGQYNFHAAIALLWLLDWIGEQGYSGSGAVLVPSYQLLAEIGFMDAEPVPISELPPEVLARLT